MLKKCKTCGFFTLQVEKNIGVCMINGARTKIIKKCPFKDKEVLTGYVAFCSDKGDYVLSKSKPKDWNIVEVDDINFDYDHFMKYAGKKIKLIIEILEA